MDSKHQQQPLNGAYYGPAIPPQAHAYNNVGRRSSCGPCSCLCSLIKFLISIVIILGIVVLVLWLVFRPNEIKAYVTAADLSQFNLSTAPNTNLQYDLSLNMSIRNPNKRIGIYYDYIEAQAMYDGSRFGYTLLPTFYQGHKNTTELFPVFNGQGFVLGDTLSTYNREKGEGFYYVDVKLYTRIRLKVWIAKIHAKPHIDCTLKLPVPGKAGGSFESTECDVDLF